MTERSPAMGPAVPPRLRLGVVAVSPIDPWDARIFSKLASVGIRSTVFAATKTDEEIPQRAVDTFREASAWRRIRTMEALAAKLHGFAWDHRIQMAPSPFAWDDAILGLRHHVRDFDVLLAFETYRASTYQACRDHPAVVVKVTENLPHHPQPWPYPWFRRSVRERARRFVCVSKSSRDALLEEGFDPSRIRVIPEPVDTDMFRPEGGARPPAGPLVIGYAAKLDASHGLPDLIQAFAALPRSIDAKLRIAGDGAMRTSLPQMIQASAIEPDRVEYVGSLAYSLMPDFLRSVDVLCVPARAVPGWVPQFGVVNIEAMACGKPIVATRVGATPEIVPAGLQRFLAPQGDVAALAAALEALAKDLGLREQLGREARAWALEKFDMARLAGEWAALLFEVLDEVRHSLSRGG